MSFNKDFYLNYARDTLDALNKLDLDHILSDPESVQKIKNELAANSNLLNELAKTLEASKDMSNKYGSLSEMLPQLQKLIEMANNKTNDLQKEFNELLSSQDAISNESEKNLSLEDLEEIEEFRRDFVSNKPIKIPKSFLKKLSDASLFTIEMLLAFLQVFYYGNYVEGAITATGAVLGYSDNESFKSIGHMMCVVSLSTTVMEIQIFDSINKYISDSIGVIAENTKSIVESTSNSVIDTIKSIFHKIGLDKNSSLFEWLSPNKQPIAGLIESPSAVAEKAMNIAIEESRKFTISKQVEAIINKAYSSYTPEYNKIYLQSLVNKVVNTPQSDLAIQEYQQVNEFQKSILEYALSKIDNGKQVGEAIKEALTQSDSDLPLQLAFLGGVSAIMLVASPLAAPAAVAVGAAGFVIQAGTPLFIQQAINFISGGSLETLQQIAPHLMQYVL